MVSRRWWDVSSMLPREVRKELTGLAYGKRADITIKRSPVCMSTCSSTYPASQVVLTEEDTADNNGIKEKS